MNSIYNNIDIDSIFTDEWYQNIVSATIYALSHIHCKSEEIQNKIALTIVDYNIEKSLKEAFLANIINELPKTLNWKNIQVTKAFSEFKNIIDTCCLCPTFKEYRVKILFRKASILLMHLLDWKKLVSEHYPDINISLISTKDPNAFYLKLEKNQISD